MKKSELIHELAESGIHDREWLHNRIDRLRRHGWKDNSGAPIRNIKGFLWQSWKSYQDSPWRDVQALEQRISEVSNRIDSLKANPDNWHRDRSARWKHEERHAGAYRAFVLDSVERLSAEYPERFAAVTRRTDKLLVPEERNRLEGMVSSARGEDVTFSRDELLYSMLRLEFTPTELPTFWDWARTHAPFNEKGRLRPEIATVLGECYDELRRLREEKEEFRQKAAGKQGAGSREQEWLNG